MPNENYQAKHTNPNQAKDPKRQFAPGISNTNPKQANGCPGPWRRLYKSHHELAGNAAAVLASQEKFGSAAAAVNAALAGNAAAVLFFTQEKFGFKPFVAYHVLWTNADIYGPRTFPVHCSSTIAAICYGLSRKFWWHDLSTVVLPRTTTDSHSVDHTRWWSRLFVSAC